MSKTRVVLNHAGFRDLLTSGAVQAEIERIAQATARSAGDGYEVLPNAGRRGRAGRTVAPSTAAARRREARDHPLLGVLGGHRG